MEHWWADFKSIWLAHSPQPQTFEDLEQLVTEGIDYFTHSFISGKRNDLTAAEYRFGKANQFLLFNVSTWQGTVPF